MKLEDIEGQNYMTEIPVKWCALKVGVKIC
jgi:hypothetical protein